MNFRFPRSVRSYKSSHCVRMHGPYDFSIRTVSKVYDPYEASVLFFDNEMHGPYY